jgi:hypothetical protein
MTPAAARGVANLILVSAGLAAAYVVFTTPPLRRLVATGARWWLGASIPAFLAAEVRRAWLASRDARVT